MLLCRWCASGLTEKKRFISGKIKILSTREDGESSDPPKPEISELGGGPEQAILEGRGGGGGQKKYLCYKRSVIYMFQEICFGFRPAMYLICLLTLPLCKRLKLGSGRGSKNCDQ